jgi:ABC-type multidrug transport system fused ATPase/permease subunit
MKDFYLQHKALVIGSIGTQVVNLTIQTIVFPKMMSNIFTNLNSVDRIRRNINKLAGIWLLKQGVISGRQTINMHFDYQLTRFITDEFMAMLFRKYEFAYTEINTPLVLARMNMIRSNLNAVLSRIYISLLPRVVTSLIVLINFLKTDIRVGLTILASSILYVSMIYRSFDDVVTRNIEQMITFYENTITSIDDKFSNIETIVLTPNATEREIEENRKRTERVVHLGIKKDGYKLAQDNKLAALNIILLFAILQSIQTEYARGKITTETVSSLILMVNNMNDQMSDISYFIPEVMTHLAYIDKHATYIDELLRFRKANTTKYGCLERPETAAEPAAEPAAVHFERVSFAYDKDKPVINDLTFDIPLNRVVCLYGVSGIGKSTITKLMLGNITPQSGDISIHGTDATTISKKQRRSILKYIPQNTNVLFNTTIYNNIIYGHTDSSSLRSVVRDIFVKYELLSMYANIHNELRRGDRGDRRRRSCDDVGEFGFLDFVVGRNGSLLSGGQRQMVHIIRCMLTAMLNRLSTNKREGEQMCATESSILILDEPTTALDNGSKRNVLRLLSDINAMEVTVIIISHDEEVQKYCDYALVVYRDQSGIRIQTKSRQ